MTYQPGDILFFSGNDAVSRFIKGWTLSWWSHVGIVARTSNYDLSVARSEGITLPFTEDIGLPRNLIYESTNLMDAPCILTQKPVDGVQVHDPYQRTYGYSGTIWRWRLTRDFELNQDEQHKLVRALLRHVGTDYDMRGAIKSGSRWLKQRLWPRADLTTMFCSEYVARSLQVVGRLPLVNPSGLTPGGLYRRLKTSGVYQPELTKVWPSDGGVL